MRKSYTEHLEVLETLKVRFNYIKLPHDLFAMKDEEEGFYILGKHWPHDIDRVSPTVKVKVKNPENPAAELLDYYYANGKNIKWNYHKEI